MKIALFLVMAGTLLADTIELKTGEKIEGRFKQATDAGVVIEVGGQPITFTLDKVRAIYLGAVNVAPAINTSADALAALKGLRSVTTSGINYQEYSTRVLDAKVVIDRYRDLAVNDPARDSILSAMKYYETASQAWGLRLTRGGAGGFQQMVDIGAQIEADPCPDLAPIAANGNAFYAKSKKPVPDQERRAMIGSLAGGSVALFWKCGANKVSQAESLSK